MRNFLIEVGRIPSNLDLGIIFKEITDSKTIINNLKNGTIYIISVLTIDNYYVGNEKDGYTTLNNKILEDIVGQKRPKVILDLLIKHNVIETRKKTPSKKSTGYRLTEKYNTGEFTYIKFSNRIIDKLKKHRSKRDRIIRDDEQMSSPYLNELSERIGNYSYPFLFEQFKLNPIQLDIPKTIEFIKILGQDLLQRISTLKPSIQEWNKISLYNYLGRLLNLVEDFNKDEVFEPRISITNLRLSSKVTHLPKILRPFLCISGEPIGEIDISSSQPYILSTILNDRFTKSKDFGYNLYTIYQQLFMEVENLKNLSPSHTNKRNIELFGVWFDESEFTEIRKFVEFDFINDFYNHILNKGILTNSKIINMSHGRSYIKNQMMNFLFERNDIHRENNEVIKLLKEVYPQLYRFIEYFHSQYTSSDFSYLLQRTESYLILGNVCEKISQVSQNIPFYTIHDSVLTTHSFLEEVRDIMNTSIKEITGKSVSVKIKHHNLSDLSISDIIDKEWKESILITTQKKYDRKKRFLLGINIKKGKEILNIE